MRIALNRPISKTLRQKIEGYTLEVGILEDKPHKNAKSGLKSLAGGPARRVGRGSSNTISEVAGFARSNSKVNFWVKPFQKKTTEATKFLKSFLRMALSSQNRTHIKRLENLLGAMVRVPILRGAYGSNRRQTAEAKGFNRKLIDTGQLFKAIRGRVRFSRAAR